MQMRITATVALLCIEVCGCGKSGPWLDNASIASVEWEAKGNATALVRVTVRNDGNQAGRVNVVCEFYATPQWEGFKRQWEQETVHVEPRAETTEELWLHKLPTAFGEWKYRVGLVRTSLSGDAAQKRVSDLMTKTDLGCYLKAETIACTEWQTGTKPTYVPPGMR